MNFTAAPAPVSFRKPPKSRRGRKAESPGKIPKVTLRSEAGLQRRTADAISPSTHHPVGTGRQRKKRFLAQPCWHQARSSKNARCFQGLHTNSTHPSKRGPPPGHRGDGRPEKEIP